MFTLDAQSPRPLVTQIVDGFRAMIDDGSLRPGAKLPSIRQFAACRLSYGLIDKVDRLRIHSPLRALKQHRQGKA